MLILLSPAKKLDYQTPPATQRFSQPDSLADAEYLIHKLKRMTPQKLAKMMHISPSLARLNHERYQNFRVPFSNENSKQAVLVFKGDVYQGLAAEDFTEDDFEFAQRHLRILSGLYGVLKPLDLIQPYRLEMGCDFAVTPKKQNLYRYWGDRITRAVNDALQNQRGQVLVNLASNEYFKSIKLKSIEAKVISPGFKDLKNGQYKPIFLWVKQARGMMARYIIKNRITDVEGIKGFDQKGYAYNEALSTETQWVFTRDKPHEAALNRKIAVTSKVD